MKAEINQQTRSGVLQFHSGNMQGSVTYSENWAVFVGGRDASDNGTNDTTEQAGHAVQVVDSTRIVESKLFKEERLQFGVAKDGDKASSGTNHDGTTRPNSQIRSSSNCNTTSQRSYKIYRCLLDC